VIKIDQETKEPFHEIIAKIQENFRKMADDNNHQAKWTEGEKKQFYDELSGDT